MLVPRRSRLRCMRSTTFASRPSRKNTTAPYRTARSSRSRAMSTHDARSSSACSSRIQGPAGRDLDDLAVFLQQADRHALQSDQERSDQARPTAAAAGAAGAAPPRPPSPSKTSTSKTSPSKTSPFKTSTLTKPTCTSGTSTIRSTASTAGSRQQRLHRKCVRQAADRHYTTPEHGPTRTRTMCQVSVSVQDPSARPSLCGKGNWAGNNNWCWLSW